MARQVAFAPRRDGADLWPYLETGRRGSDDVVSILSDSPEHIGGVVATNPSTTLAESTAEWLCSLATERRHLEEMVAELSTARLAAQREEAELGEIAGASQHPADVATDMLEREIDFALIDEFSGALQEIQLAEVRVAQGTYGACERCHGSIGPERLAAVPATRWCYPCAASIESERWLD